MATSGAVEPAEASPAPRRTILVVAGCLAIAGLAAAGWYFWGARLDVVSSPGAAVSVDGVEQGVTDDSGMLRLRVRRGRHTVRVLRAGYEPASAPADVSWTAWTRRLELPLIAAPAPRPTPPPAAGTGETPPDPKTASEGSTPPPATAAPARPVAAAPPPPAETRAESESDEHVRRARALFEERQYDAALRACDVALAADPRNEAARALQARIRRTIEILRRQPREAP